MKSEINIDRTYTYLALGDSYTVGEAVQLQKNFPYQTVQLLRQKDVSICSPEIVAKTGWTTDELEAGMAEYLFLPHYDFVTLLIGVNNQYRGRSLDEYRIQFETLLNKSIRLAGKDASRVFVLSIPDYGVTPAGMAMDPQKITHELDAFNTAAKEIALKYKVGFLDITESSREAGTQPELVAKDGLHPSEKEYAKWAVTVSEAMFSRL